MLRKGINFIRELWRQFKYSRRFRGFFFSVKYVFIENYYDRKFRLHFPGLETNRDTTSNLSINHDSHHNTSGSFCLFFSTLKKVQLNFPSSHFLDYGSGTGKILCAAMSAGFNKVTGIDLDEEGILIAKKNCGQTQARFPAAEFELIRCDASVYRIPDSVNVIFLFNPFGEQTMRQVVQNINESLKRAPRKFKVIYQNPVHESVFTQSDFDIAWRLQSKKHIDISLLVK